jgi:hypothetical protein
MFCAKCGAEINEGADFCPKCGAKAGSSAEGQNTGSGENRGTVTQAAVMPSGTAPLVMGILGLFGGFIPVVQYFTGLLSLLAIFLGVSQRKKLKGVGLPTGKATAGIVLGSIAVLITVIFIAVFASFLGSLFGNAGGGNRSSNVNVLPEGIQGTTWTNGSVNIEFGKNKIKLDGKSYRIQGVYPSYNLNRVFFSNKHVRLERTDGNVILRALVQGDATGKDIADNFYQRR